MTFTFPFPYGDQFNGYTCGRCGGWVPNGCTHSCPTYITPWPAFTWPPAITTTVTAPDGALLRVSREDDAYFVTDLIGTRYGHGADLAEALRDWAEQVEEILGMDKSTLGNPLLSEVEAYRKALGRG